MSYLCLKCYKIMQDNLNEICSCGEKSNVVFIDDLLAPAIKILNQKGYKTLHCCSGHYIEDECKDLYIEDYAMEIFKNHLKSHNMQMFNYIEGSYIMFEKYLRLPSLPTGYIQEQNNVIRKWMGHDNEYELFKLILNNSISMLEWAQSLPNIK